MREDRHDRLRARGRDAALRGVEPSRLGDEAAIELRQLTRLRQELKESVADLKRQVIVALDQVFPEYDSIFSNTFRESSKALEKRCPTRRSALTSAPTRWSGHSSAPAAASSGAKADEIKEIAKASCGISVAASDFSFDEVRVWSCRLKLGNRATEAASAGGDPYHDGLSSEVVRFQKRVYDAGSHVPPHGETELDYIVVCNGCIRIR